MSVEDFDLDLAEELWRDTAAVLSELLPTAEESADRFHHERFEASVTNDDARLVRLAEEAREAATCARELGFLYGELAEGIEQREMMLVHAACDALRRMARREFRFASSREDGVQGVG